MELTPEIEASVKDQLTPSFLDACSGSHERETLAELVYNTAISNSSVQKAKGLLDQQLTTFGLVLTGLGAKVNLDGSWFPFGALKAETLGAVVNMGSTTQYYVGQTPLIIGSGDKAVGASAIWIGIN